VLITCTFNSKQKYTGGGKYNRKELTKKKNQLGGKNRKISIQNLCALPVTQNQQEHSAILLVSLFALKTNTYIGMSMGQVL